MGTFPRPRCISRCWLSVLEMFLAEVNSARSTDRIVQLVVGVLHTTFGSADIAVHLVIANELCCAGSLGEAALTAPEPAGAALRMAARSSFIRLTSDATAGGDAHCLASSGVELAYALRYGSSELGVVLVGPTRGAAAQQLEMVISEAVVGHAAAALHLLQAGVGVKRAEQRRASSRQLGLAHDVGKQMAWLQVLARRSSAGFYRGLDVGRDLSSIGDLAADVSERLRSFLDAEKTQTTTCVPLDEIARAAIARVERLRGRRRISQLEPSAWSCCEVPQALEIVLENLLDNAVLASPQERPVRLSLERGGGEIRISVEDRGEGMDRELKAQAFRYGFTTRKSSGAQGLGLAVSRQIVLDLGGRIRLVSERGRGTRVSIHLPLETAPAERIRQ